MISICVILGKQEHTYVETGGDRMVWSRESNWCHVYSNESVLPDVIRKNKSHMEALSQIVAGKSYEAGACSDEKEIFVGQHPKEEWRSKDIEIQICGLLNEFCNEQLFEPFQGDVGLSPEKTECHHRLSFEFTDTLFTYIDARMAAEKDGFSVSRHFKEWVNTKNSIYSLESQIRKLQYELKDAQKRYEGLLWEMTEKIPYVIKEALKLYLINNPEQYNSRIELKSILHRHYDDLVFNPGFPSEFRMADMFPIDLALHTHDGCFLNTILLNGGHYYLANGTKKPERIIRLSLSSSVSDLRAYGIAKQRWFDAYQNLRQEDPSFVISEVLQAIVLKDYDTIHSLSTLFPDETSNAIDKLIEEGRIVEISEEQIDGPESDQICHLLGRAVYIKV